MGVFFALNLTLCKIPTGSDHLLHCSAIRGSNAAFIGARTDSEYFSSSRQTYIARHAYEKRDHLEIRCRKILLVSDVHGSLVSDHISRTLHTVVLG